MSSVEIKAKIKELTSALADFELQVNQVVSKYQDASSKVSSINSGISDSQDTLIIKAISNTNSLLIGKINRLIGSIESSKKTVVSKINDKISDLEVELRIALAEEAKVINNGVQSNTNIDLIK